MIRPSPLLAIASLAVAVSACAVNPEAERQAQLQTQQQLAVELAGRTPGKPVDCIRNDSSTQLEVIDDQTLLYRDGRTIYLQRPLSACHGLANRTYTLVTKKFGTSDNCRGDINQLVDLRTGMQGGACVFDQFVPYTKAG